LIQILSTLIGGVAAAVLAPGVAAPALQPGRRTARRAASPTRRKPQIVMVGFTRR